MEKIIFKTNWQYTPFLEGKELKDGDIVNIKRLEPKLKTLESVEVQIEKKFTNVYGVSIPQKIPYIISSKGEKEQLTTINHRAERCQQ